MSPKVAQLIGLVQEGFALHGVQPSVRGELRLVVHRGEERRTFDFAFYEVPALVQATRTTGQGA